MGFGRKRGIFYSFDQNSHLLLRSVFRWDLDALASLQSL